MMTIRMYQKIVIPSTKALKRPDGIGLKIKDLVKPML